MPSRAAPVAYSSTFIALLLAGCFLTTSFDGLTGGETPTLACDACVAVLPDASPGAELDAGAADPDADSAVPVSPTDSAIAPDAASDAAAADVAAPDATDFCLAVGDATLCDDFESHPVAALWTQAVTSTGASAVSDRDAAVSPVTSYLAILPAAATAGPYAYLVDTIAATYATFDISFDFRLDAADPSTEANVFAVGFGSNHGQGMDSNVALYVSATSLDHVDEADPVSSTISHSIKANLVAGQWVRVFFSLTLSTTPVTLTVQAGPAGGHAPTSVLLGPIALRSTFTNGPVEVRLGPLYAPAQGTGWRVRYDDALIEAQ